MVSATQSNPRNNDSSRNSEAREQLTWPQDLSHSPALRIGEVRSALSAEFPLLTVSKIRHYESIGLVEPQRTPSNQRLFSAADVERLRFVLVEQRDRFLPLSQIGELLRQLDAGESPRDSHPGRMRVIEEVQRPQPGTRLKLVEVSDLTGVPVADIEAMISVGILSSDSRGRLTSQSVEIVRYAWMLESAGFDLRQIRTVKNSAHSHAALITASVAPERAKATPAAGERALAKASEDSAAFSHLYRALLAENVEVNLR
ncbi:MAG: transcriptional regulator FtsR [Ancrocorticia sp.]|uniref:transcriptional regulator FtsR n=1 Tax=Ancrocorticia sp. TaxID=2593684 RepID=UPI003F90BF58